MNQGETTAQPASLAATQALAAEIVGIIDALEPVLEEEAALARAGRLAAAAALQARKAELAAGYLTATQRLKAQARQWPTAARPALAEARARHERLRAALQMNMTVVATAHAVAEDLIRGAAAEAFRRQAPQTYGASGRASAPPVRGSGPIAINRAC
jgi:hypothetical protein